MRFSIAVPAVALLLQATPLPKPTSTAPVYFGRPAVRFAVASRPLGFDPDGNARWLVVARFYDAQGKPTRIMANSDLDWNSRDGYVQWQTRLRFGQPSAIVKTSRDGVLHLSVRCNYPSLGIVSATTDTRTWHAPRVVAEALGPHLVQIGWFPQELRTARVVRYDSAGTSHTLAIIAGPSSTYRDGSAEPGHFYRYTLYRAGFAPIALSVRVPARMPATRIANVSGKAMWLYFTTNPLDAIYYRHLDPAALADRAARAGLHYVELRTAYGAYWEITPEAKPTIDAIVDQLARRGIGTIGWTVPRDTTFEDLQTSVRTAYYRTARGTRLAGVAVDLERGGDFMGGAPQGLPALWQYMAYLRAALGPKYLLMATIEDPYLEHLTQQMYPYRQIARYTDVLQPMTYWRMLRTDAGGPAQVAGIVRASFDEVQSLARRPIPISVGGQTNALGQDGSPPANEITASLDASKAAGAIGECFFAWDGTQPDQWNALAAYRWP